MEHIPEFWLPPGKNQLAVHVNGERIVLDVLVSYIMPFSLLRQCLILAALFIKPLYHCALFINMIENI